jgi:Bifunctional DNA primase/polymerase, N-terminal/Primase C terminal 1 (PriCT-1)
MTVIHESTGLFSRAQPAWAEHRVATFPVSITAEVKKPGIRGYGKVGLRASRELAHKRQFARTDALGFMAGPRSRVTVLDIDAPDEHMLADALDRHGRTPFVVRTASGKFHAYYKHAGERRRIRPWPDRPIDLLGANGFVVAPPSLTARGAYTIIEGKLDDLDRLPPIRGIEDLIKPSDGAVMVPPAKRLADADTTAGTKGRNDWLWRECMRRARSCDTLDALLDFARTSSQRFEYAIEQEEIMKIVQSAWDYTQDGTNRFGSHGAWLAVEELNRLMQEQDAFFLLAFLRTHNGPWANFMCANGLAEKFGWDRRRLAAARHRLIALGYIRAVRQAGRGHPARFEWLR